MRESGHRAMLGRTGTMVALAVLLACPVLAPAQPADLIIRNGRVIDPESGLDEVRTVLVSGGQISDVTATDVAAERIAESTTVVDASGLVVAPGRPVTACPMTACNGRKPASG